MHKAYKNIKWLSAIRFSSFIINCWLLFKPSVKKQLSVKKKFYRQILKSSARINKLIFDVGANEGFVTNILFQLNYNIVAIEPDEENLGILNARFKRNKRISIEALAVGKGEGAGKLYIPQHQHALATFSEKWKSIVESRRHKNADVFNDEMNVRLTTLDKLIEKYGLPAFVKIDVEGYESEVLRGLTHPLPLLSFECILPAFHDETLDCLQYLLSLNENYLFNISSKSRFLFAEFVGIEKVRDKIPTLSDTIEIFARLNGMTIS